VLYSEGKERGGEGKGGRETTDKRKHATASSFDNNTNAVSVITPRVCAAGGKVSICRQHENCQISRSRHLSDS
jgi:hypothetical protein